MICWRTFSIKAGGGGRGGEGGGKEGSQGKDVHIFMFLCMLFLFDCTC
jgi:hypothetical protein